MLVAVTGATGFVGKRVVRRILLNGHQVLAFGRRSDFELGDHKRVQYHRWDVRDGPIEVPKSVAVAVHCAAHVTDWASYEDLYAVNVEGTKAVLETFRGTPQFVHMSTASVYDPSTSKHYVSEHDPGRVSYFNGYAETKMLAERQVSLHREDAIVLRPHAVYGPGDTTLLPRLIKSRRFGRMIGVGNGQNRISVTHVDNLAIAVVCALRRTTGYEIYHVADAHAPTLDEILRSVAVALGFPPRVTYLPQSVAWTLAKTLEGLYQVLRAPRAPPLTRYIVSQISTEYTLSTDKARTQLGYQPRHGYQAFVRELARHRV